MKPEQVIKEGDWFCAIEGLAIADKIFNFYFEEFDKIPQDKKVGDYKMSVVQYRLFCDFDGNPIKRNLFKIYNAEYVSPITPKYGRILKKSIKENPKEYASFVKFLKTSKEVKGHVTINYALTEDNKEEIIQNLNTIRGKLQSKFTFMDLVKVAQESQCVINMNNVLDDVTDAQLYVCIYLVYRFGDSLGKRILFNDLGFEIRGGIKAKSPKQRPSTPPSAPKSSKKRASKASQEEKTSLDARFLSFREPLKELFSVYFYFRGSLGQMFSVSRYFWHRLEVSTHVSSHFLFRRTF